MDKAMAQHSVRTAFYLNRSLINYLDFMKFHATDDEFKNINIKVAEAIDKINVALISTSIKNFPEIEIEIERDLDRYGRYL